MKKKFVLLFLSFLLIVPFFTCSAAQATDTKSATIGIPTSIGLTGVDNSAKAFYLDLPSGVSSSAIKTGTLKYSGANTLVGNITLENGKIKVTLKGNGSTQTISNVQGFSGEFKKPFKTTPGNSIWLYSNGRRWQINEYKALTDTMDSYDLNADDNITPSANPPLRLITTKSNLSAEGLIWYNNSSRVIIDPDSIIQSTVKPLEFSSDLYIRTPNIKTVQFKDNRIIVDYMIPRASNDKNSFRTVWKTEPDDGKHDLSGHAEGRRYQITEYYYYLADAKLTTYNYAGNITFDYNLPTDAELNGTVSVLTPNPNPTKYADKDVPVQLSLRGELLRYTNTSNISEWVFYAKEKGKGDTLQTKKDYSKTLNTNKVFDFTIPKSRVTSDNYKQEYELTVIVRFSNPVTTQSGTITYLQQPLSAMVEVYKNHSSVIYPSTPPAPAPKGEPPVAVLMVPPVVKAGEDVVARGGGSYDPDGEIKNYFFEAPGSISLPTPTESTSTFWYPVESIGENTVGLTVVDNDMMTGSTGGFINVVHPTPDAKIEITGTKKQNRKVILTSKSTSPFYYPLDQSKTIITIEAMSGGTNADIKYAGTLSGITANPVLFKKPGIYRASIYVENTLGYSATDVVTFEIVPDEPPVVYFSMQGRAFRDPLNGNQAVISIDDMSYSPDGDIIDQRLWEYRYDSDNDGNFEEEAWVIFSNENKDRLTLTVTEVGKYEIRHTAYETFGQPTIDAFITSADRKYADSSGQNTIEKIVDVKNRAPQADWSW
ncbi:hypothetical protein [Paenibacillus wynnii]|uniref:hypothetical protein n=1 Tax=Paenibacillus wynnii TaxID=268407 RepID=UPI00278E7FCD|nr:hypothetical protein [Paenibacillus wynnii]MDQ0195495.1 hypothetical protein [Paenibacillus wynnii]